MEPAALKRRDRGFVEWRTWPGVTDHGELIAAMTEHTRLLVAGQATEQVWMVEFAAGYSRGRSAKAAEFTGRVMLPVRDDAGAGRGGGYSYHGPGVRVGIVMLDLKARRKDMPGFGRAISWWLHSALLAVGVDAYNADWDPAGLWVGDNQLAAVGFRVTQWVTSYGFAINVAPDLSHFDGIVPCGVQGKGITSLEMLGLKVTQQQMDVALRTAFHSIFGATTVVEQLDGARSHG